MTQTQEVEIYEILASMPNVPAQVLNTFLSKFIAAADKRHQWPKLAKAPIRTDRGPYQFRYITTR